MQRVFHLRASFHMLLKPQIGQSREYATSRIGISEVETAFNFLARIIP